MTSYSRTNYRETEILTAPPQKLRLMLIQAAIRSIEQARQHWHAGNHEQGFETLVHGQEIVTELISGINPQVDNEITRKAAAIYLFIFRCLVEANFQQSEAKLDDALRVLREEQETWRLLCEKLGDNGNHSAVNVSLEESGKPVGPPAAPVLNQDLPVESAGGFSLEA